ncbi:hypothetical protein [Sulfobacillus sp. hq2]|uniref:hypothetical protein n=1 Tax=Sulfobacillus TaxID=28033 RepID=UPI000CD1D9DE|nr:hypothetical protein [Sulfobacillus sp. hq2]POB12347.1 hypothetical protein CO251_00040 [Sulfobacillus sp. hq2]
MEHMVAVVERGLGSTGHVCWGVTEIEGQGWALWWDASGHPWNTMEDLLATGPSARQGVAWYDTRNDVIRAVQQLHPPEGPALLEQLQRGM